MYIFGLARIHLKNHTAALWKPSTVHDSSILIVHLAQITSKNLIYMQYEQYDSSFQIPWATS